MVNFQESEYTQKKKKLKSRLVKKKEKTAKYVLLKKIKYL